MPDLCTCLLMEIFDSISYYYVILSCTTMPPTVHNEETSLQIRRISHFSVGLRPDDIYHCTYQYCLVSIVSFISFPVLLCPSAFILISIHIKDWIKGMAVNAALMREEVSWDRLSEHKEQRIERECCLLAGVLKEKHLSIPCNPKIRYIEKFPDIKKTKTKKQ